MRKVFSEKATDLLMKLLEKNPEKRLGYGSKDASEIKKHPFFEGVDWDAVRSKELKPFFIPKIKSVTDVKYIDNLFTDEDPTDTPLDPHRLTIAQKEDNYFDEFTYVHDNQMKRHTTQLEEGEPNDFEYKEEDDELDPIYSEPESKS